jgi:hypothetical protein
MSRSWSKKFGAPCVSTATGLYEMTFWLLDQHGLHLDSVNRLTMNVLGRSRQEERCVAGQRDDRSYPKLKELLPLGAYEEDCKGTCQSRGPYQVVSCCLHLCELVLLVAP